MQLKNIRKVLILIVASILLLIVPMGVYAETASELQEQQSSLQDKIDQTNSEIAGVKNRMSNTLTQINRINSQISGYQDEIEDLQGQLSTIQGQIDEKAATLDAEVKKQEEQKELLNKRLVALYETSKTSYLDMLLNSDSLSDFVSKYYMIDQLAEYDQEVIAQIEVTKQNIENEKKALEDSKVELENNKKTIESKTNALAVSRAEKSSLVSSLTNEEKELEEQLEAYEAEKREVTNRLASIAKKNNYTVVSPSAAGYGTPIAGKTKANITCGYYGYAGHTGVDFAVSSGTPVLAVKSGTVVISKASMRNGRYVSYGNYIVIDHHDGTMTLYAHLSSRGVGEGQSVSQGQQIGLSGSTGNSTGPHLHFEVRVNGRTVNPTAYLP